MQRPEGGAGPEKRPAILNHGAGERNFAHARRALRRAALALALVAAGMAAARGAEPLVLLVQPPPWREPGVRFDAAPLAALLSRAMGRTVVAEQATDALSHWRRVRAARREQMALEEAHFTAWRIRRHGFVALARAVGDVRFALLVRPGTVVTSPADLSARRVAVPGPPALAALRLLELFPQPGQEPRLVVLASRAQALDELALGGVDAAMVRVGEHESIADASIALVTDASPGRGFSLTPALAARFGTVVQRALAGARRSAAGRAALAALGLTGLEPAADGVFEDSERLLRGTWGYADPQAGSGG